MRLTFSTDSPLLASSLSFTTCSAAGHTVTSSSYTPLSVKICFLLWKFQLEIVRIRSPSLLKKRSIMVTHAFPGLSVSSGIFIPLLLTGAAWGRFVGAALEEVGLPIMRMSNSLIIVETFRSYQPAISAMLILVNMLFLEQLQCSGEW